MKKRQLTELWTQINEVPHEEVMKAHLPTKTGFWVQDRAYQATKIIFTLRERHQAVKLVQPATFQIFLNATNILERTVSSIVNCCIQTKKVDYGNNKQEKKVECWCDCRAQQAFFAREWLESWRWWHPWTSNKRQKSAVMSLADCSNQSENYW